MSIIPSCCGQVMKIYLIGYLDQFCITMYFFYCPATCMQIGDEDLLRIILSGRSLLVKMFINLEPHGIFSSHFAYYTFFTFNTF